MLTIVLSGPKVGEQQARNALVAARFDVHDRGHDYGLPPLSDQQAEAFLVCEGEDVDKATEAVRGLGWTLRMHLDAQPNPADPVFVAPPDPFVELASLRAELEALKARVS